MTNRRKLTKEEITEARKVFGDEIDYSKVHVIDAKYFFLQGKEFVMAPDGNLYWPGECGNLVLCGKNGLFIHEMTHVMQYQKGINVLFKSLLLQAARLLSFGLYNPYEFDYDPDRAFDSYNLEQQGEYAREIYSGKLPNTILNSQTVA